MSLPSAVSAETVEMKLLCRDVASASLPSSSVSAPDKRDAVEALDLGFREISGDGSEGACRRGAELFGSVDWLSAIRGRPSKFALGEKKPKRYDLWVVTIAVFKRRRLSATSVPETYGMST